VQKYVLANSLGMWVLDREKNNITNLNSTKVTLVTQVTLNGLIPFQLVDNEAMSFLSQYADVRKRLSKDYEIDKETRSRVVEKIHEVREGKHTVVEKECIQRARDRFRLFNNVEGSTFIIPTKNMFVTAVAHKMEGKVWCKFSTTLRCNDDEALAFFLDVTSCNLMSERDTKANSVDSGKKVLKDEGHSRTVKIVQKATSTSGTRYVAKPGEERSDEP